MRLLTAEEVRIIFQFPTRDRVYELARQGVLPAVRCGRQIRFSEEAIREWIAKGGKALPGGWRRDEEVSR